MSDKLKIRGEPDGVFYAIIRRPSDNRVWNGSTFTTWSDAAIATYALSFTHQGGGLYQLTFPSAIPSGNYLIAYYFRRGESPATDDLLCDLDRKSWDGESLITPSQATPADIADAVWDEASADHTDAGTTGAKINSAAAAGDPLASSVPGEYESGTAGYALGTTLAQLADHVNRINPGRITTSAAVLESGQHVVIVRGDSYTSASPRGVLPWTPSQDADWPDLTDATGTFTVRLRETDAVELTQAVVIQNPAGPDKRITVSLTAEQTATLSASGSPKDHKFDVQLTLADGSIWTPIRGGDNLTRSGGLTVIEDQTRPVVAE